MSALAQHKPAFEILPPAPSEARVTSQAEIDLLEHRLKEAELVARQLQSRVSSITGMGVTMSTEDSRAIELKAARDRVTDLRMAIDDARATLDREMLATVPDRFAE